MSTNPHSFSKGPLSPDVLGELLHLLSQPLTSLRCSLELSLEHSLALSIEEAATQRQESVAAALQQTEKVIGMIQLMREYFDAEQPGPIAFSAALEPTMRSVVEELSSIAAVRGVRLLLVGRCTATLCVAESRLRLALQYLIAPLIEAQPAGGKVMLLLGEGPAGTVLRGEGERGFRELSGTRSTLRRVRLAIASRVLRTAGASLVLGDSDSTGFVLCVPRRN
ncbi:MAG: hypothetical protein ABSD76_14690 [Terriglobales bacterium]|jgi:hypothetical protein